MLLQVKVHLSNVSVQEVFPFHYLICFSRLEGVRKLGGSLLFLYVGPSILFIVFPFFGAFVDTPQKSHYSKETVQTVANRHKCEDTLTPKKRFSVIFT